MKGEDREQTVYPVAIIALSFAVTLGIAKAFSAQQASTILLGITAGILVWYSIETQRLRNTSVEANLFAAMTRIHEVFSTKKMYEMRGYLRKDFNNDLNVAIADVLGQDLCITNNGFKREEIYA